MAHAFSFRGVIPILATPFHPDESLDLDSLTDLIRFNIDAGVDAVTVLGLLGESNRLTDLEREAVITTAVEAADGVPVIAGTSHTGTTATMLLSEQAVDLGATAVMITPSVQPVPSETVVLEYFQRIARVGNVPIILQDHPAISQVHMSAELILRLIKEIPNIVGVKAEAVPSPQKIAAIKKGMTGRDVPVLTGLGALYGFFDLERGSDGFNTGFAFPEVLMAILREARAGRIDAAREIYQRFLPLIVFEQQPGVGIRKAILRKRGLIASHQVRHPGRNIDAGTEAQLDRLLASIFAGTATRKAVSV